MQDVDGPVSLSRLESPRPPKLKNIFSFAKDSAMESQLEQEVETTIIEEQVKIDKDFSFFRGFIHVFFSRGKVTETDETNRRIDQDEDHHLLEDDCDDDCDLDVIKIVSEVLAEMRTEMNQNDGSHEVMQ
ncbi:hypothetical protein HNY73_015383 [Argiope bruennichi]|uniref:Uncharacterized protein n=1 Tax=Argiope bruennichi TaxID=94029 RepID=A0A8T0ERV2_ARGBR|nr:hypothetical protein HNY73_015383 [Argiope bruennichi]